MLSWVGSALKAIVTGVHDGTADLDVRGKRMRASVRDLRVVGADRAGPRVNVSVQLQTREAALADLNVIGCTVDEAIARAERFLDESLLTDQRIVRLIHGYGTGQLKRALAGFCNSIRSSPDLRQLHPNKAEGASRSWS
mgnify:CR=1 FL=1